MILRAVAAFLVLPGMVAFVLPAAWVWYRRQFQVVVPAGLVVWAVGVAGLLWCVWDFYRTGKGTLAPWSPPEKLVTVGLYRYSRNPMYVSVLVILLGWSIMFASAGLLLYACVVAVGFHLRVVLAEEPYLARVHGSDWQRYAERVRRWV